MTEIIRQLRGHHEPQEELAFLQAHDCDEAQGYYFSRPMPSQQFAEFFARDTEISSLPEA